MPTILRDPEPVPGRKKIDKYDERRRDTIKVAGQFAPRPAPRPVPETDRAWRPREFVF